MSEPTDPHVGGKELFDHLYARPDLRAYFAEMRELDDRLPQVG